MLAPDTTYTLHYFPIKGLAEQTRLLLELGGLKFENKFVQDWIAEKPHTPYGQVPVLSYTDANGKEVRLAQSTAINRFVAKRGGLQPADDATAALVDGIVEAGVELRMRVIEWKARTPESHKEEVRLKIVDELIPAYIRSLTKLLDANGGTGWFTPANTPTVAEVAVYATVHILNFIIPDSFTEASAPALLKVAKNIENHPKIKAYHASDRAPKDWLPSPEQMAKAEAAMKAAAEAAKVQA